ncbi:TPA: hypothetical protein N0F65_011563 [Lagenidium giganteum]|uniref:Uncharacterized protein n=1 Tax=Lagenidium giganteum TaxID=4803 RepID=A0AAV2YID5_9STRA|nr:TPA: hypothetical protein N0F65_011563 [Lagenidium giganteum]
MTPRSSLRAKQPTTAGHMSELGSDQIRLSLA